MEQATTIEQRVGRRVKVPVGQHFSPPRGDRTEAATSARYGALSPEPARTINLLGKNLARLAGQRYVVGLKGRDLSPEKVAFAIGEHAG